MIHSLRWRTIQKNKQTQIRDNNKLLLNFCLHKMTHDVTVIMTQKLFMLFIDLDELSADMVD
jgi:hypothetical protein